MITVAHHINNATASILGRAHVLDPENASDVRAFLELVNRQTGRIQMTIAVIASSGVYTCPS
ncbi:MAG: hypothetical protein MAG453_00136 [Calditrichaeota bacterium]|nr:hypothetical protein [Calditrichota bacterium]